MTEVYPRESSSDLLTKPSSRERPEWLLAQRVERKAA